MADDGNVVAPIDVAQNIYKYIKIEGPPQGVHIKVIKTKIWWPTMSSDLLKTVIATSSVTETKPLRRE